MSKNITRFVALLLTSILLLESGTCHAAWLPPISAHSPSPTHCFLDQALQPYLISSALLNRDLAGGQGVNFTVVHLFDKTANVPDHALTVMAAIQGRSGSQLLWHWLKELDKLRKNAQSQYFPEFKRDEKRILKEIKRTVHWAIPADHQEFIDALFDITIEALTLHTGEVPLGADVEAFTDAILAVMNDRINIQIQSLIDIHDYRMDTGAVHRFMEGESALPAEKKMWIKTNPTEKPSIRGAYLHFARDTIGEIHKKTYSKAEGIVKLPADMTELRGAATLAWTKAHGPFDWANLIGHGVVAMIPGRNLDLWKFRPTPADDFIFGSDMDLVRKTVESKDWNSNAREDLLDKVYSSKEDFRLIIEFLMLGLIYPGTGVIERSHHTLLEILSDPQLGNRSVGLLGDDREPHILAMEWAIFYALTILRLNWDRQSHIPQAFFQVWRKPTNADNEYWSNNRIARGRALLDELANYAVEGGYGSELAGRMELMWQDLIIREEGFMVYDRPEVLKILQELEVKLRRTTQTQTQTPPEIQADRAGRDDAAPLHEPTQAIPLTLGGLIGERQIRAWEPIPERKGVERQIRITLRLGGLDRTSDVNERDLIRLGTDPATARATVNSVFIEGKARLIPEWEDWARPLRRKDPIMYAPAGGKNRRYKGELGEISYAPTYGDAAPEVRVAIVPPEDSPNPTTTFVSLWNLVDAGIDETEARLTDAYYRSQARGEDALYMREYLELLLKENPAGQWVQPADSPTAEPGPRQAGFVIRAERNASALTRLMIPIWRPNDEDPVWREVPPALWIPLQQELFQHLFGASEEATKSFENVFGLPLLEFRTKLSKISGINADVLPLTDQKNFVITVRAAEPTDGRETYTGYMVIYPDKSGTYRIINSQPSGSWSPTLTKAVKNLQKHAEAQDVSIQKFDERSADSIHRFAAAWSFEDQHSPAAGSADSAELLVSVTEKFGINSPTVVANTLAELGFIDEEANITLKKEAHLEQVRRRVVRRLEQGRALGPLTDTNIFDKAKDTSNKVATDARNAIQDLYKYIRIGQPLFGQDEIVRYDAQQRWSTEVRAKITAMHEAHNEKQRIEKAKLIAAAIDAELQRLRNEERLAKIKAKKTLDRATTFLVQEFDFRSGLLEDLLSLILVTAKKFKLDPLNFIVSLREEKLLMARDFKWIERRLPKTAA